MASGIVDDVTEPAAPAAVLTPEQIQYAKDVIAGRVTPPPLECPEAIEDLREQFPDRFHQILPSAIQSQVDYNAIRLLGQGKLVAYATMPEGYAAVLVVGTDAVFELLDALTHEERTKACVTHTADVWW